MRDYERDLTIINDTLAGLLGTIIMHIECFTETEMEGLGHATKHAMKACARIEELLTKEFDDVTVTGAGEDETA
jgi:hypothetical protein